MSTQQREAMQSPDSDHRLVIAGAGIAGLLTAYRLLSENPVPGREVLVMEASQRCGGLTGLLTPLPYPGRSQRWEGLGLEELRLEVGAESFATKSDAVPRLLERIGLLEEIEPPRALRSWIISLDENAQPYPLPSPVTSLFGIPTDPMDEEVRHFLGEQAALRAATLDAQPLQPCMLEDPDLTLGALVRQRMGQQLVEKLVAPIVLGVFSRHPDDLPVHAVHPGLLQSLREQGALGPAVARLKTSAPAGSAVAGIRGGIGRIAERLRDLVEESGGHILQEHKLEGFHRQESGLRLELSTPLGLRELSCAGLVLALPGRAGEPLVRGFLETPNGSSDLVQGERAELPQPHDLQPSGLQAQARITLVTLIIAAGTPSAQSLEKAPRGTGALVAPSMQRSGFSVAKALTHSTAKWSWLAERAQGREVIRLSFSDQALRDAGIDPSAAEADEGELRDLLRLAVRDASAILGEEVRESDLEGYAVESLVHESSASAQESSDALVQESVRIVGSWASGTGLAAVVGHGLDLDLDRLNAEILRNVEKKNPRENIRARVEREEDHERP